MPSWLSLSKLWLLLLRDALVGGGLGLLLWLATSKLPIEMQPMAYRAIAPFTVLTMAAVYGNNPVLVPWLFDEGRYGWYALALLLWVLVLHRTGQIIWPAVYDHSIMQPGSNSLFVMLAALALLLMWRTAAQRRQQLQGQLLEREQRQLLESQVNPHFLCHWPGTAG